MKRGKSNKIQPCRNLEPCAEHPRILPANPLAIDIPCAYALIPAKTSGGVPAWHLLKIEVKGGVVISVDKSVENLRGVHLVEIENDILRDA